MAKSCKIYFPDTEHEESVYINNIREGELYLFPSTAGKIYVTRFDYTYEMEGFTNVIEVGNSDATLFRKSYGVGASFGIAVGVSDVDAEVKDSLGSYSDGIAVGIELEEDITKKISVKNGIGIGASVNAIMYWNVSSDVNTVIEIGQTASAVLGYYRLLNEMDEDTLATYDEDIIKDVDYIITDNE